VLVIEIKFGRIEKVKIIYVYINIYYIFLYRFRAYLIQVRIKINMDQIPALNETPDLFYKTGNTIETELSYTK
jgi:hypothetical protein